MRPYSTGIALALVALAAGAGAPGGLAGQVIEGRVVEPGADTGLPGVHLRLLGTDDGEAATEVSDDSGHFQITAPAAGGWRIAAERLGYGSVLSDVLELDEDESVRVEIRMAVEPVVIDEPVVVLGARSYMSPDIEAFHRRRRWAQRTGMGYFLHGEEIQRRAGSRPSDLLRMIPGVSVARGSATVGGQIIHMRGGCVPAIYIDGSHINSVPRIESLDRYVDVENIEGIEVYRGAQASAGRFHDRHGCGLVLVWTKRGEYDGSGAFSWSRLLVGVGLILALVALR